MKIFLDGQEQDLVFEPNCSLSDVISSLGLNSGHLAIRINNHFISHQNISRIIQNGDEIELINIYAGG